MNRVVITGIGMVSPIGNDKETFWNNVKNGVCGIRPIENIDVSDLPVKVAAQVLDFDPLRCFDKKELRRTDPFTQYAVDAALQAVEDCGTKFEDLDPYRIGVIVGSGIGGFHSTDAEFPKFLEKGPRRVSVFYIPEMIANMGAGTIAIRTGFKGVNYAPVTACATGSHAIGEAFRNIKHGYLDACLAGGSEAAIIRFSIAGFDNMQALTHATDPNRASIPFDAERSGFVMGEGAGIVMLEELEHAKKRGAHIYAEIVGYGATGDAYHMTSPDPEGEGAAMGMKLAYQEAGITPDQIDYINAHGTSTHLNEKYETIAIKKALGEEAAYKVMVSSTKSLTGHMLGAAGGIEAIICAKALEEGFVPATTNSSIPDPECDLHNMFDGPVEKDIHYALSNSLGFGGHNATLCLKKYEG